MVFLGAPLSFLYVYVSEFGGEAVLVHGMKTYGEWSGGLAAPILTSALDAGESLRRRLWHLKPPPVVKRKLSFPCYESNRIFSIVLLIV